jgi:hypothetical protein
MHCLVDANSRWCQPDRKATETDMLLSNPGSKAIYGLGFCNRQDHAKKYINMGPSDFCMTLLT